MKGLVGNFLTRHGAKTALAIVIALILVDTIITYSYKSAMSQNIATQHKLSEISARKGCTVGHSMLPSRSRFSGLEKHS